MYGSTMGFRQQGCVRPVWAAVKHDAMLMLGISESVIKGMLSYSS